MIVITASAIERRQLSAIVGDKTMFEYFIRTVQPDSLQAKAMADIEYFNWTYVIAMHTDDIYGTDGINTFIKQGSH